MIISILKNLLVFMTYMNQIHRLQGYGRPIGFIVPFSCMVGLQIVSL